MTRPGPSRPEYPGPSRRLPSTNRKASEPPGENGFRGPRAETGSESTSAAVEEETPTQDSDDTPPRSIGGLASVIAAVTGLVLLSIIAFWIIGTHQPATGAAVPDNHIFVTAETDKQSSD